RRRKCLAEGIDEIVRPRISMWLEGEHDPPSRISLAQSLESRSDLGRVMSVVIDDRYAAGRGVDIGDVLQPAIDALEVGQRALDRRILDPDLTGYDNRRQRVQDIVRSGQVDGYRQGRARGAHHIVSRLQAVPT